jgi:DNA-binding transcriptional regulator YiaG
LGLLLGITQRAVVVDFDHSKERYSRRKLIPVNPKTLGDHIHLKRIEAGLSQPEVAKKTGVSVRMVRKWEYGLACPNEGHWQALKLILSLTELPCRQSPNRQSSFKVITQHFTKVLRN